jgi:S-DNA-T family DNA segregation ATPase FtsK/SpoIIIE
VADRDADLPPALRPFRLEALPTDVAAAEVLDVGLAAHSPLWFPFGVGGDDLDLLGLDLGAAPVAIVAGPAQSGRTSVLRLVVEAARRRGQSVLGICPRVSELSRELGDAAVVGAGAPVEQVVEALRSLPSSALIVVDDAEMVREGPLVPALQALVRQAREKEWAVVVAGQTTDLSSGMSGWLYEARRGRQGLLLSPSSLVDAEVVQTRLSRSQLATSVLPGRGLLVRSGGEPVPVQVPRV